MASSARRARPTALVWASPPAPRRRATPTAREIAAAGVRIADEAGLDAVTMRRLAEVLGTGTTSIYRYVADKDELVERMLDEAYGAQDGDLVLTGDWHADLRAVARGSRMTMLRHPWLADSRFHRPAFGPNSLARMELALAASDGVSPNATTAYLALTTVLDYVAGSVARQLGERAAQRESGLDWEAWQASIAPLVRRIVAEGTYPHVSRRIAEADEVDLDAQFDFGLDCLIRGIDSRS